MNCQECGMRPATLHFTKIINGEKSELHFCETCAKDKGEMIPGTTNGFSIHNLISGLLNFEPPSHQPVDNPPKSLQCEQCGMTYTQFSKMGRFGCSNCYQYFNPRLDPLLRRIHGSTGHVGKIPKRSGGMLHSMREIDRLKQELREHIEREEFEQAAAIRDRIKQLEKELSQQ